MTRKVPRIAIGIFVTLGVVIGVGVVIWVSASKYFEKGEIYVTYFDESVQGLQRDSTVKYRGVDIGRISSISVAPDNVLIEVVMKLDMQQDVVRNTVARLKPVGITGIVFIDLGYRMPEEPDLSPKISFKPEYPVVPSRPSELRQFVSTVDQVMEKIKKTDVQGAVNRVESAARTAEDLMTRPEVARVLRKLDSATAHFDAAAMKVDRILAEGKFDDLLSDTRRTLIESQKLVTRLRDEVEAVKLTDTTRKIDQMVDNLDRRSRAVADEIRMTSEDLGRASKGMELLMERLRNNPSDLLFSRPPPRGRSDQDGQ